MRDAGISSRPHNNPALGEGSQTCLPCLFDIAVFCMSIYQWVFFTQATEGIEWLGSVVTKTRLYPFFHDLFTSYNSAAQDRFPLRAADCTGSDTRSDDLSRMPGLPQLK